MQNVVFAEVPLTHEWSWIVEILEQNSDKGSKVTGFQVLGNEFEYGNELNEGPTSRE